MRESEHVQPLIRQPPYSLAGNWVGNFNFFIGFWTADDGSEFGILRSADRPLLKLIERIYGYNAANDGLLRHFRRNGLYMLVAEDLSFVQWGCPGTVQKMSLDGSAQKWLAPALPIGLSTFRCTSCSSSLIAFEVELPRGLALLSGELKLTSDGRAFHLTVGKKTMMMTLEFQRPEPQESHLQGSSEPPESQLQGSVAESKCPELPERLPSVPDEDLCWVTRLLRLHERHVPSTALYISATMLGLATAVVVWQQ
mmetsp:Transcript_55614/g.99038  ORF Transcript_55614/g.99038 Transcript_55614/m.99038 type:complete len:254 (-) Transcript_55614:479-1240(-)|eukprot:CAMPEP_0197656408 /NCGR_PEP_ID=MMETSP1338-20131121/41723_1 /TAXON_ID=43686 ORGANISM="Pelagodinium beii, Strain RCC1491" /NCGR_SAMPLE_ID=MMETSP1338 /ASSEMBLY_ACC=CAM_ASM_000754 /LENGTH=253 /DNA_ID=CAMNT_0043232397 /DNA_START=56 /DNA_END=817 /DNA_ORIENTATION=+